MSQSPPPSPTNTNSTIDTDLPLNPASPMDLTPRSKVRALLRTLDSDSDDDVGKDDDGGRERERQMERGKMVEEVEAKKKIVNREQAREKELGRQAPNAALEYEVEFMQSSDEQGHQEQAHSPSKSPSSNLNTIPKNAKNKQQNSTSAAAYARLQKQLLSKSPSTAAKKPLPFSQSSSESENDNNDDDEDDEDEEPVQPTRANRRSKFKPARQTPKSPTPFISHPSRQDTPSLFVSPRRPTPRKTSPVKTHTTQSQNSGSDSDALPDNAVHSRLQDLVTKKRAENKAQRVAAREKAAIKKSSKTMSSAREDGTDEDDEVALTQHIKPTRKASKKALEEMTRETQRLARNQQLTHQARTRKKFTLQGLFKTFNFRQGDDDDDDDEARDGKPVHEDDGNGKGGALDSSDVEAHVRNEKDTPPTSPPSQDDTRDVLKGVISAENEEDYIIRTGVDAEKEDDDLPSLEAFLSQSITKNKGKSRAMDAIVDDAANLPSKSDKKDAPPRKQFRFVPPAKQDLESDDELEIVPKSSRFAVFDNLPAARAKEGQSFRNLRALAQLNNPEKVRPKGRNVLSMGELQAQLQERARKQARVEKQEKLDDLRARGIIIQTEEEREQDQIVLENMLDKARIEAQALAKKEKDAATKEGADGEARDILSDDEDGDWAEEEDDDADVELSGSEDEIANAELEEAEDAVGALMDDEAGEDGEDEGEADELGPANTHEEEMEIDQVDDEDEQLALMVPARSLPKSRARNVILDDEDEEVETDPSTVTPAPTLEHDDTMAAFGFQAPQMDGLGLTQMFKGSMADLDSQSLSLEDQDQDSLAFLRNLPAPAHPGLEFQMTQESQRLLVKDSQASPAINVETQFSFNLSQYPSQQQVGSAGSPTRFSEVPDPTQDVGFEPFQATRGESDAFHSTVDTIMISAAEPPSVKKMGKLRRRTSAIAILSDAEDEIDGKVHPIENDGVNLKTNAFDALFKTKQKPSGPDNFDKERSEAKKMVQEQAEESEDEYAGLGGASDDENDGEMDDELKEMIDESPVDVDTGEISRFYADKERAEDEKRIDKLYKDITTGNLRRKRGADLDDLSDSDDEAEERRRRKQREFAQMRKALLADENIGKIAENPKKMAFLRAIEDRDEEEDLDMLDDDEEHNESVPDSQEGPGEGSSTLNNDIVSVAPVSPLERQIGQNLGQPSKGKENIAPMSHRRRPANEKAKRPTTLAEIRDAVSFLIDEPMVPDSQVSGSESGSDHERDDGEDFHGPKAAIHREARNVTILTNTRPSVVNRLASARKHDENDVGSGLQAFHAATPLSLYGFKVPSLLRRATTNSSTTSNSNSTTSTSTSVSSGAEQSIRRGGSKKSNIHYQAREAERRMGTNASDMRRKEQAKRSLVGKGKQSVLGILGRKDMGFE